jgi:hypothetical protein
MELLEAPIRFQLFSQGPPALAPGVRAGGWTRLLPDPAPDRWGFPVSLSMVQGFQTNYLNDMTCLNRQTNGQTNSQTSRQTSGQASGQTSGQTNGQTNGQTSLSSSHTYRPMP